MTKERFYPITSLHKDDLRHLFRDAATGKLPLLISRAIDALTHEDMKDIASKLADQFCNCCYWDVLEEIFEDISSPSEGCGADEPPAPPTLPQEQEPEACVTEEAVSHAHQLKGGNGNHDNTT